MPSITLDPSCTALLLIDLINDLDFAGGEDLLIHARSMTQQLTALRHYAREQKIPIIYANDNFGQWHANFQKLVEDCLQEGVRGREIVEQLQPSPEDFFILKPKHSAFYHTSLEILLNNLGVTSLVITGMAADICVLFTANDAYMRGFRIIVPSDCVASEQAQWSEHALQLMQRVLKADITPFAAWNV